jgi:hypothetical protein
MSLSIARTLLPKGSIIGVSCNTKKHIETAVKDGADYVGIGAVWETSTKALTSPIIGVRGVGEMLKSLDGSGIPAVAIGMFDWFPRKLIIYLHDNLRGHQVHECSSHAAWLCINHGSRLRWNSHRF